MSYQNLTFNGNNLVFGSNNLVVYENGVASSGSFSLFNYGIGNEEKDKTGNQFTKIITAANFNRIYEGQYETTIDPAGKVYGLVEYNKSTTVEEDIDQYTKLLLHANGDLSPSHHNLTYNGGVKLDYVATPVGSGAYYFDGTDDYIIIPDSDDWNFGNEDITIAGWINPTQYSNNVIVSQYNTSSQRSWIFYIKDSTTIEGIISSNGSDSEIFNWSYSTQLSEWQHFAITRASGNLWELYIDGTTQGVNETIITTLHNSTAELKVGASDYFQGHMADLQITKGEAKYTSNFTAPTTRAQPDANTVLLLSGSGDYGTTGHSVTTYNGVKESSDSYKFGSGAFYFDGTNDYLSVPDSEDWNFGSGDFAIDFWIKYNSLSANNCPIGKCYDDNTTEPFFFEVNSTYVRFYVHNGSTFVYAGGNHSLGTSSYNHITANRNDGTLNVFVNGTQIGSSLIFTGNIGGNADALTIGDRYLASAGGWGARSISAYMDELRISNGVARWTDSFDVPDSEYRNTSSTSDNYTFKFYADQDKNYEIGRYTATERQESNVVVVGSGVGVGMSGVFSYDLGV